MGTVISVIVVLVAIIVIGWFLIKLLKVLWNAGVIQTVLKYVVAPACVGIITGYVLFLLTGQAGVGTGGAIVMSLITLIGAQKS